MQEFDHERSCIIGLVKMESNNILMLDVEKIVADIDPKSAIEEFADVKPFDGKPIAVTAEDSSIIRKMITDKLKLAGFEIDAHKDGAACWQRLKDIAKDIERGKPIESLCQVVITDIEMPEMDGYTLTKNIKTHPILSQLPVVLFSSIITPDLYHKGKAVGADAQMTKPQIGELLQMVSTLINDKSLVNKNKVTA
jgi:two-component system chemotaxis response regulator CheV